jgi:hypothetical protein
MPEIYKNFTVCDLTTQLEEGGCMARATVVVLAGSRALSQRSLDCETFDAEAEATARAQAWGRACIDEQALYISLALPTRTIQ